jgi:hypothetical protein
MKCILSRTYNDNETPGSFIIMDGERSVWSCKSIELPYNGNQRNTSCIPEGVYNVVRHVSPTKGKCFHVLDVPGRDNILIHVGNYAAGKRVDTLGCILPGIGFKDINNDGNIDVFSSKVAMDKLLEILPDSFQLHII